MKRRPKRIPDTTDGPGFLTMARTFGCGMVFLARKHFQ